MNGVAAMRSTTARTRSKDTPGVPGTVSFAPAASLSWLLTHRTARATHASMASPCDRKSGPGGRSVIARPNAHTKSRSAEVTGRVGSP